MLVEVTLRCFRQHVNRTFTFTEGLNLLRAKNEGGKSTILEAVRYALGGARALSEPISDVVTWDYKDTDLAVKVVFSILGVTYTFERSVKGATVNSPALQKPVTGQTEVTNFASDLFGGSSKTLSLLLLASQNGLQDVIDAGPGEVSGLVAKLGNLDVVDAVLAQAEQDLVLGNEKIIQDRISSLISMEEQLVGSGPAPDELERMEAGLDQLRQQAQAALDTLEKVWHPAADVAAAAVEAGQREIDAVTAAAARVDSMLADITTMESSRQQAASVAKPDESKLVELRKEKATAEDMDSVESLYLSLKALNSRRPANVWEAEAEVNAAVEVNRAFTEADNAVKVEQAKLSDNFNADLLAAAEGELTAATNLPNPRAAAIAQKRADAEKPMRSEEVAKVQSDIDDILGKIAVARRDATKVIDAGGLKCHTCGRDFDNAQQRREHIEREQAEVDAAKARLVPLEASLSELTARLAQIKREVEASRKALRDEADEEMRAGEAEKRVAVTNAQAVVTRLRGEISLYRANASAKVRELSATRDQLLRLLDVGLEFSTFARQHEGSDNIEVDYRVYPPKIEWVGPQGRGYIRKAAEVERDIQQWESYRLAYERAQGVVETLDRNLAIQRLAYERAKADLDAMPRPDLEAIQAHHREVLNRTTEAQVVSAEAAQRVTEAAASVAEYRNRMQSHEAELRGLRGRLEDARKQLAELQANNAFVKEVKRLKPLITEHMWSKALAAISNYFSDLRGQSVVVTREGGSFRFNDRPASSLSGSGKDILAIAIRAALGRVFLPHIGMIVLDEPAHGSDEERTSRILGFLSKCGYEQIVLASHDPLSESVADNIIYVQDNA